MFTVRRPFFLSLFLFVIFAEKVHGNATENETASPQSADDPLPILLSLDTATSNDTNGKNETAAIDVENMAKTVMHILLSSVDAVGLEFGLGNEIRKLNCVVFKWQVMRFFGDILSKVTQSLDGPMPHKVTFLANGTAAEIETPQTVPEEVTEANVQSKATDGNGTTDGEKNK